ncbi:hypothetical protein ACGFT2_23355 [Streptomyces sp. NPDC048514]|uniref:hypothetical protein n=1 Tax=Streptomyces sp. NPDC048514 TaxID=3365564 RepID=UPI0037150BC9
MPGRPSLPRLPGTELAALVTEAVDELARRLAQDVAPPAGSYNALTDARQRALAHLHVLGSVRRAIRHLEDEAARAAAASGATYPEIGQASNMSRQGARRRWPGLVTSRTTRPTTRPTPRSS